MAIWREAQKFTLPAPAPISPASVMASHRSEARTSPAPETDGRSLQKQRKRRR